MLQVNNLGESELVDAFKAHWVAGYGSDSWNTHLCLKFLKGWDPFLPWVTEYVVE